MKKKTIKTLALNKSVVTELTSTEAVLGGQQESSLIPIVVGSALVCTRWNGCDMPTIGSGDGSNCLSTDGKGWCGGR
jgi:hypothetical protein